MSWLIVNEDEGPISSASTDDRERSLQKHPVVATEQNL